MTNKKAASSKKTTAKRAANKRPAKRVVNLDRNRKRKYNRGGENIEHLYGYVH